jgi:hypothetical protein
MNSRTKANGYCRVLVDDVTREQLPEVLKLFTAYSQSRVVILLLISSDLEVMRDESDNSRYEVHRFQTEPISPSQALAFVSARINLYRDPALADLLTDHPLFPFTAEDIEANVGEKDGEGAGVVTLRLLNTFLNKAIRRRLEELRDTYDLATVRRSAIEGALISVVRKYEELVA